MTLLAYFSKDPSVRTSYSPRASPILGQSNDTSNQPPLAFDIPRAITIDHLKEFMLRSGGKHVTEVDKVTIWRVDMSWPEMLSCEGFGGLKDAGMPWP
jgi:hypothetical protein